MSVSAEGRRYARFGPFEVDLQLGELLANGSKVKLQEQPLQILALLLERPGELVMREEIRQKLWPDETFVDFEHSINTAVKKLRAALRDDPLNPRYIETIPRRGYRFLAPVAAGAVGEPSRLNRWVIAVGAGALVALLSALFGFNVAGLRDRLVTAVGAGRGVSLPKIESIAVLPLENLSGDKEQEFFADGMTEELITNLGKVGALRIVSRQSVMRYKGSKKPLPEIARELNVDAIVEGTVQRSGNQVRITANLLHAATDRHLWADRYERDLRDVLALQGEVAQRVVREIKIALTPQERGRLAGAREINPEAYMLYVQGKFYLSRFTPEEQKKGLRYLHQAVEKDPTNPMPYAGLALAYCLIAHYGEPGAYERAKEAANKALELDPNLAEAHAVLAEAKLYNDYDSAGAAQEFKRALALNANIPEAHAHYGWYLQLKGHAEEAIAEERRAQELSPLEPVFTYWLGLHYQQIGRNTEAMAQARKTLELDPGFPGGHDLLAMLYMDKGIYKEAIEEARKAAEASPELRWSLGVTCASAGRKDEAREIADGLKKQPSPFDMWGLAAIYSVLGEKDEALRWLEAAYQARFSWMLWIRPPAYRWSPFSPLYDEPRFQNLRERLQVL